MNRKAAVSSILILQAAALAHAVGYCSLPQSSQGGASRSSNANVSAMITVGRLAGLSRAAAGTLGVGPMFASQGGYTCFMSTNAPIAVAALLGTASTQKMVPSADQTMLLEWESSTNPLPVTYSVYTSTNPNALVPSDLGGSNTPMMLSALDFMSPLATGISGTSVLMTNVSYLTPYYWEVITTDQFGRYSVSQVYSFSIAPMQTHMIAAPNPFHPGNATTSIMFTMNGPGSAEFELYSLPDGRRLIHRQLPGLAAGVNIYIFDGHDDFGRLIPTGVFTIRMTENGATSAVETFKIIAVH